MRPRLRSSVPRVATVPQPFPGAGFDNLACRRHSCPALRHLRRTLARSRVATTRLLAVGVVREIEVASVEQIDGLDLEYQQKNLDRARALAQRALAIREDALGLVHPDVAETLGVLASIDTSANDFERARVLRERELKIAESVDGPDAPSVAYALFGLGMVALYQERASEAVVEFERALEIRITKGVPEPALAETRFALARALWRARGDRQRALALAEESAAEYRKLGPRFQDALGEVDIWLAGDQDRCGFGVPRTLRFDMIASTISTCFRRTSSCLLSGSGFKPVSCAIGMSITGV